MPKHLKQDHLHSSYFNIDSLTDQVTISGPEVVSLINTELGNTDWQQQANNAVQTATVTFTDRTFLSGSRVPIFPAPGVNNVYDIITIAANKNLTTGYTVNFGTAELDFFIGNVLILADQGGLQLQSPGIRFEKMVVPNYSGIISDYFGGIINHSFSVSTGSLVGGQGTIKIDITYRIHSIE